MTEWDNIIVLMDDISQVYGKLNSMGQQIISLLFRGRTDMPSPPITDGSGKAGSKTPYESMLNKQRSV